MAQLQTDSLLEIVAEVLESSAFVSLSPADPSVPPPENAEIATIELVGAGRLHIAASPRLGSLIAANIMGFEPGSPEADAGSGDALKEILNITAGGFSSRLDPVPEMCLPQITPLADAGAWKAWVEKMSAEVVLADEHPLAIAFEAKS